MKRNIFILLIFAFLLCGCGKLKYLLVDKPPWDYDKDDWSAILQAAYNGDIEQIEKLIEQGEDINKLHSIYHDSINVTALDIAVLSQQYDSIVILLELGASVGFNSGCSITPLMYACEGEDTRIIDVLLEYGADINESIEGWTPLKSVVARGSSDVLNYILQYKVDIDYQEEGDLTALMLAVYNGDDEKVKILLHAGADEKLETNEGFTASDYNKMYNADNIELFKTIEELLAD